MEKKGTAYQMRVEMEKPFETAVADVTAALKAEGFGVLTEIDMQGTLKQKIGAEIRRYTILGACNPPLAHQALQAELEIGLLLPCNVIVYEGERAGSSVVSIVDPGAMLGIVDNPNLAPVADEAQARLARVAEALAG